MSSNTRPSRTLASHLTLWNASIFVVFFGLAFILFYIAIRTSMLNDFEQELYEDVEEFRLLLSQDGWQAVTGEIDRELLEEGPENAFFRISDGKGKIRYASDLSPWRNLPPLPQLRNTGEQPDGAMISIVAPDDEYSARVAIGWIGPDSVLEIGETTEELYDFLEVLLATFSGTFILVVVFASVAGWLLVRRAMRGVEAVTNAAVDVANGTLNRRVDVATEGREIERLAATFNLMLERIHTLISGMREMTDNVAHDLRSPLARIRANAEMALSSANTLEEYRHATADTLEECDRLMHLINTTLDVAEAEAGIARHDIQTVNVSQMAREACELFAPLAEDKHISVETEIQPDCRVPGNLQLLQRMLANLLDNAFKYSEADSRVTVRVASESDAVRLSVGDSGVGISLADQARIFDRFFRCDQSRNQIGCGLGLSLVRAVAAAHQGDVKVSSAPGGGSKFTVILPAC